MNHYVYLIENKVNGKKYIGKHSTDLDFFEDDYYGSGILICQAINKYGKENFSRKLLGQYKTEAEAFDAEEKEIDKVHAYESVDYYNLAKGGKYGYKNTCNYGKYNYLLNCYDLPLILDPKEYINSIESNFNRAEGSVPERIYYYIAYKLFHGIEPEKIKEEILFLVKDYAEIKKYTDSSVDKIIESISNISQNDLSRLCDISTIVIKESEMKTISSLNYNVYCKVLTIALLFYKRFAKSLNDYVRFNEVEIFKYAHVSMLSKDRDQVWDILSKLNLIEFDDYGVAYCLPFADFGNSQVFISFPTISQESFMLYKYYTDGKVYLCQKCGGILKTNKRHDKKYCCQCSKYKPIKYKSITCIDCGKVFEVKAKNNSSCRCNDCYKKYRANRKIETQKIRRNNQIGRKML